MGKTEKNEASQTPDDTVPEPEELQDPTPSQLGLKTPKVEIKKDPDFERRIRRDSEAILINVAKQKSWWQFWKKKK